MCDAPGMRLPILVLATAVGLVALPSCSSPFDEDCETISLAIPASGEAAEGATCAAFVGYEGHLYVFTCATLMRDQLGGAAFSGSDRYGQEFRGRPIEGVPVEEAIALSSVHAKSGCGKWQLAYNPDISPTQLKRVSQLATPHQFHAPHPH